MTDQRETTAQQRHRARMREVRREFNRRRAYGLERRRAFRLGLTPDRPDHSTSAGIPASEESSDST